MEVFKNTGFVIFDVETTGLSADLGDRIVEIGALKIKDFKIVKHFVTLINPERTITFGAYQVNGITNEMLSTAPKAKEVLPEFLNFLGNDYLVGHNLNFDLGFLNKELSLAGYPYLEDYPTIDTIKMARKLIPYIRSYSLESIGSFLKVGTPQQHRALDDVKLTLEVFLKLLEFAHKQGINDVESLSKMFGLKYPKVVKK